MENSDHQAGFVTIIGNPNTGKSTLINRLVGEKLSIITKKAQTTRRSVRGIINGPNHQLVLFDTPGILTPAYALHEAMMEELSYILIDADIVLWMVEANDSHIPPLLQNILSKKNQLLFTLINKVDLLGSPQAVEEVVTQWKKRLPDVPIFPIAASTGFNVDELMKQIVQHLPIHPPYYPTDMFTDQPERFFAAEIIRKQILLNYQQEIPYAVEVVIDYFKDLPTITHIHAILYVEKHSQKAILIGKGGANLKQVGIRARQQLEAFLERSIFLQQHVKILPGWRNKRKILQRLGYMPDRHNS